MKVGFKPVFIGLFVCALFGLSVWSRMYTKTTIRIGGESFVARVADSQPKRTRGLSGDSALDPHEAMLFIFPHADQYQMWMKDMQFSIDIIWIRDGKIVDIAPRLAPALTADETKMPRYTPRLPADRVVEVVAGTSDRLGLKIGDAVEVGSN